jgi:Na+-driven multidrug efflux pump
MAAAPRVLIVPIGVGFIIQSFAAQLTGQSDPAGVTRCAWYGLIPAGLTGLLALAAIPALDLVLRPGRLGPAVHQGSATTWPSA